MSESAQLEPTEIAGRLRPTIDCGRAVLLVGGTLLQRSEWIERVVAATCVENGAAPLVVRVRTCGAGSLADELTTRAEEALERLRAPGGLYEESSCAALPALGGWLFRARSVQRLGLLFVIEEVDGFLDLRGDRARAEDSLEALGLLLEERERRPVSLLCSVRAADAAGSPAIPAAIAALYDERVSLKAARTVARDPTSLIAVLSGRSFTKESLARAVVAWADVSDNESVIVFSSPLSPTMVPAPISADEPEVRWPSEPVPETQPSVATEAPADRVATTDRLTDKARSRGKRATEHAQYMPTFRAAIELRSALDALGEPAARRSTWQLERAFSRSICRIPLALEALRVGAAAVGASVVHIERRATQALALFEQSFAEAYASAYAAWVAGATRPTMLPDLVQRLRERAVECGARSTALVLCTGLRADEWPALRAAVRSRAAGISVLEEGLHWAARPVTVAAQRALLARGAAAIGAPIHAHDEPTTPRNLEEAALPRREVTAQGEFHRISAYQYLFNSEVNVGPHRNEAKGGREAARSRDALQPLSTWLDKARSRVAPSLAAFVAGLPSNSLVLLAADVGAASPWSVTDESGASAAPREPSVFEVLVPHAFLLWSGRAL